MKDGPTLEDTIDFCSRLVSASSETNDIFITLQEGESLLDWAKAGGATLAYQGKPLTFIGKQHLDVAVLIDGKQVGRVVKQLGKPYEFIPVSATVPDEEVYEKLNIAL